MAVKIVIDAGHGGYDNGASYEGRKEKDDALKLALAVGKILTKDGYDVIYTRTDDVYDAPIQKARIANESGADYFVSIHRNSSPTPNQFNGVQTLVYDASGIKAEMAENVNKELEKVGYRNINVSERPNLVVLKRTEMPAILVEAGFINSTRDNELFDTKFNETAEAIAKGIDETIKTSGGKVKTRDMLFESAMAEEISAEKAAENEKDNTSNSSDDEQDIYQILVGVYDNFGTARYQLNRIINDGYYAEIYEQGAKYQLRVGEYNDIEAALVVQKQLRDAGYNTLIIREDF